MIRLLRHLFRNRVTEVIAIHDATERQYTTQRIVKDAYDGRRRAELYLDQDRDMGFISDCDWWAPCNPEDGYVCRVCCPACTPMSPCLGHDRVWAAVWNERLRCQP
jgi:hypothetical protein